MKFHIALLFIVLGFMGGAAPQIAAAPSIPISTQQARIKPKIESRVLPRPVTFREVKERGLLVRVWVNDTGPYSFAVDTGAGITLISGRVASLAGTNRFGSQVSLGGLSGASPSSGTNTTIRSLAIGDRSNLLSANQKAIIIDNLPYDIDGVLDPTEAYLPFGYSIDLPNRELAAFDPRQRPLNVNDIPEGGTVVRWLGNGSGRRPFVRLGDGRLALLDTGSGFGLAISREGTLTVRRGKPGVHDLGGGRVTSERISPSTISIGSLMLRRIPTDLLDGVEKDAPILLGRDALSPFRLAFDPVQRLIEIAPVSR